MENQQILQIGKSSTIAQELVFHRENFLLNFHLAPYLVQMEHSMLAKLVMTLIKMMETDAQLFV